MRRPDRCPEELRQTPRTVVCTVATSSASVVDVTYPPDTDVDSHTHTSAYLCLVVHGEFEDRHDAARTRLRAGQERRYDAGSRHAVHVGSTLTRVLHITDPLEEGWTGSLSPMRRGIMWQISRELDVLDAPGVADDAGLLHLESLVWELRGGQNHSKATRPAWLDSTLERIREDYASRLGLGTLATGAGVHRSHLARSFKEHFGMTAGEYLRRIRVAAALNDLQQSDLDASHVAFRNGFSDQSHMGRCFRRYLAETPGSARARPGDAGASRATREP